jgi:hypothetical protein
MNSCGFKVTYGGGEVSHDCVELILSSFHYSNEKYDRGCRTFQTIFIAAMVSPVVRKQGHLTWQKEPHRVVNM